MKLEKMIKDIRQFQLKIAEKEEGNLHRMTLPEYYEDAVALRVKLQQEEVDELKEALETKNHVEVLDAIIDNFYILMGTAHEYGLLDKLIPAWDLVHSNNMSKIGPDGKVKKNEFGKVVKPRDFKPVDLSVLFSEYGKEGHSKN